MRALQCWRAVLLAVAFALVVPAALAHTKSETHSVWEIGAERVHLEFSIPLPESARLARKGEEQPPNEVVLDYLKRHLGAMSAGKACPIAASRALAATTQFRRFEFDFNCPGKDDIALQSSAFFDLVPSHVTFAQIRTTDGQFVEQLFTSERHEVRAAAGDAEMRDAGFFDYIVLGMEHIFTGPDHMAFMLGLVLISRRVRDLLFVVTGFTLGHSITLALAVTGVLRPHPEFIDALVGLTIAMVGAESLVVATRRSGIVAAAIGIPLVGMAIASLLHIGLMPPLLLLGSALLCSNYLLMSGHMGDAGRLRLVVTLVFGLIHGFGFAATLLEMQLPAEKLMQILVGFNVGVEIAQLMLVLGLVGLAALLVRFKLGVPRRMLIDGVGSALVGLGTFWFISRSL
ncbi:MAG: HupE/UreJ family protein [Sphingomonadaceae bacterium]